MGLATAVELTRPFPDSPERALALAAAATTERWDSMDQHASTQAEEAVRAARRSGSALALAGALSTRAFVQPARLRGESRWRTQKRPSGLLAPAAPLSGKKRPRYWRVNSLLVLGRTSEATVAARESFQSLHAAGSGRGYFLAALAAHGMLYLGRWNECRDLLRTALAARRRGASGAFARLTSAQLAVRTGRTPEAKQHLDRALELISEDVAVLRGALSTAGAEVLVASGEPHEALDWLHSRIVVPAGARGRARG